MLTFIHVLLRTAGTQDEDMQTPLNMSSLELISTQEGQRKTTKNIASFWESVPESVSSDG